MKILLGIGLCWLLAGNVAAQRGGGFRGGFGGFRGGGGRFAGPGVRFTGNRYFMGNRSLNYGWGYPAYYGDYGTPMADSSQAGPSTIIVLPMLQPVPDPPPPPPPPAKPVLHEYHWPNVNQEDTTTTFSIVTNDNKVHYATMVWVDGDTLHFTNQSGGGRLPLISISRQLTYAANPAKNLKAWLP